MTTKTGQAQQATIVSICIGCGRKDRTICESGWLAQADGLGVCIHCPHALPAWAAGARMAGRVPLAAVTTQRLLVRLGGRALEPFMGRNLAPAGSYYVLDSIKLTVIVVDQDGMPVVPKKGASKLEIGQGRLPLHLEREIKRRQRATKKRSRRRRS